LTLIGSRGVQQLLLLLLLLSSSSSSSLSTATTTTTKSDIKECHDRIPKSAVKSELSENSETNGK